IAHITDGTRPFPRLYPTEADRAAVDHLPRSTAGISSSDHLICIAPASVWFTKQWPEEKWIDLIEQLPSDRRVLLIGAPGDVPLCDRIAKAADRGEVLAGKLTLLQTAAL